MKQAQQQGRKLNFNRSFSHEKVQNLQPCHFFHFRQKNKFRIFPGLIRPFFEGGGDDIILVKHVSVLQSKTFSFCRPAHLTKRKNFTF